ncbi:MAG: sensor histidine kinase [Prevotella sp.]
MKNVSIYIDLAFCLVFLPMMIFFFPVERWWGTYPVFFTSFVAWLYVTYFLYKYLIVPRLFRRGRHLLLAIGLMLLSLAVTSLFSSYHITSPFYHLRQLHLDMCAFPVWGVRPNQQAVWLHYIIVVTFCFAVGMLAEANRQRLAREEMEYERNKAELAFYKAQINPHFLFNTLNTLYGLLITHSEKTVSSMERFISLTKYMYINASREYVPLSEEVDYISQFIELQKLRLNSMADVRFTHDTENDTLPVPPMLLITFVENAFKYGISSSEPCFIHIDMEEKASTLRFEVRNKVFRRVTHHSCGTGQENCRRRLGLLYPGRHTLGCGIDHEGNYRVSLRINLRKE